MQFQGEDTEEARKVTFGRHDREHKPTTEKTETLLWKTGRSEPSYSPAKTMHGSATVLVKGEPNISYICSRTMLVKQFNSLKSVEYLDSLKFCPSGCSKDYYTVITTHQGKCFCM